MTTMMLSSKPCSTMQRMRTHTAPRPLFAATPAQPRRSNVQVAAINEIVQIAALDIDWTDPDVQIGVLGGVLGLGLGIGAPIFYSLRDDRDEERLEELRALNRATFKETGEYLSEVWGCRTCTATCVVSNVHVWSTPCVCVCVFFTGGDCRDQATSLDRSQVCDGCR